MTLKSASFRCLLLDLTLIRTIVLFIGSLTLSSLVLPDMHGLNGTIKPRTDGALPIGDEILWFGNTLAESLINTNQLREYGILVKDDPFNAN